MSQTCEIYDHSILMTIQQLLFMALLLDEILTLILSYAVIHEDGQSQIS